MALGEMAFESGNYAAARGHWQRIVPASPVGQAPNARDVAATASVSGLSANYPDSDLDLAAVRARLVLTSILEGAIDRARSELAAFERLHPNVEGTLGGRKGRWAELLRSLLAESDTWAARPSDPDWLTFSGNSQRNKTASALADVGAVAWRIRLRPSMAADGAPSVARTIGEDRREPLSFYPVVLGDHLFVNGGLRLLAFCCGGGKPAWGKTGTVYESELPGGGSPLAVPSGALGSPRFTMTVFRDRLFARVGSTITGQPHGAAPPQPGELVCLDLAAQGRLIWKIAPEEGWAFEGSPLADDHGVYVAMRHHDIRPQASVACLDADTGRLRWRRFVCGAETLARGAVAEQTHNLLTLSGGRLYYATNLGAVASLRSDDGRLLWVSLYPRALRGDLGKMSPHWRRDPNPCVAYRDMLLVAPADSPRIFAFDNSGGQLLWQTGAELEDVQGLLAAAGDWLIAGGSRLYWISLREEDGGRVKHVWPESSERPGYGRGIVAGTDVLWPTRDKLYIFDATTSQPRKVVDLAARGASGGNLLVACGRLVIATAEELIALRIDGGKAKAPEKLAEY
jgi:outer membrane protein assembly factor BamB